MSERNKIMKPSHLKNGISALIALEQHISNRVYTELTVKSPYSASSSEKSGKNIFGFRFDIQSRGPGSRVLNEATGYAKAGNRVAVVTDHEHAAFQSLLSENDTPTPLVIFWINDRISSSTVPQNTDTPQFVCTSKEDLLPMALLAHKVSEMALCPVVLNIPARSLAWVPGDFNMPDDVQIKSILASPGSQIGSPTKTQRMVFGENRRVIPNWFDRNQSLATGLKFKNGVTFASSVSRQLLVLKSIERLISKVWTDIETVLGYKIPAVETHGIVDATNIIITEGATWNPARTLSDYYLESENKKMGVINLRQLVPFPIEKVNVLIEGAKHISVFGFSLCTTVLAQKDNFHGFLYRFPSVGSIYSGVQSMLENQNKRGLFWLNSQVPEHSDYPKRQVLLSKIKKDFPDLSDRVIPDAKAPVFKPKDAQTVAFMGLNIQEKDMAKIAELLSGKNLSGCLEHSPKGYLKLKMTASDVEHRLAGWNFPINKFFSALNASSNTFHEEIENGGEVFFASPLSAEEFAKGLDPSWKQAVSKKTLKIYLFKNSGNKLIEFIPQILQGHLDHDLLEEITEKVVALPQVQIEPKVPAFIQKTNVEDTINNIPRFYGETLQPQEHKPACFNNPEPALTFSAVPPLTGVFSRHNQGPDYLPEIFFNLEESLGLPWLFCPEGALGAVSLNFEALLQFAATSGAPYLTTGKDIADKLKRSYKHMAANLQSELMKQGKHQLDMGLLEQSFQWLLKKTKVSEYQVPAYQDAFKCMCDSLLKLPVHLDPRFFADRETDKKGSGEALITFVNPDRCNGCGLCDEVSCETGFNMEPFSQERASHYRTLWEFYEQMPDTSGQSIERLKPALGDLGAISLSKYTNFSVVGSGLTDPGSGLRLAAKMITGSCESIFQRYSLKKVSDLETKSRLCREKIQEAVSSAIPVDDVEALVVSLAKTKGARVAIAELMENLSKEGQKGAVDADNLKGFASLVTEIEEYKSQILTGNNGLGQSRYTLLITSETLKDQIPFPMNPFQVPVSFTEPDCVLSSAEGIIQDYLFEMTRLNQIDHAIQNGPKTILKTEPLLWDELSEEQQQMCPPVLVLCGRNELSRTGMLQEVLSSSFPIKLILLDEYRGYDLTSSFAPALSALLVDDAYVASCGLHQSEHLGTCLNAAFEHTGPAFIHLYTPHPRLEGIKPSQTLQRCQDAVTHLVHPLFHTEMNDSGVFGSRVHMFDPDLSLDTKATPAHWALKHADLADHFTSIEKIDGLVGLDKWLVTPDRKTNVYIKDGHGKTYSISSQMAHFARRSLTNYQKLLEIGGSKSPFTERIRVQLESELKSAFKKQAIELEQKQNAALESVRQEEKAKISAKVTDQLLRLTGYVGAKK